MIAAVRYSNGYARMRALKARLWTALDRPMLLRAGIDPDGRGVSGAPADVFPPLVAWYVTLSRAYPSARPLFTCLLRLHEIENLKLLWRAAVRGRTPVAFSWRPLEPLAALRREDGAVPLEQLVHRLSATPYGAIARALLRTRTSDLPATEIALDRWALGGLRDAADALPSREGDARRLIYDVIRERDLDLLRRGASFGLDADLVSKSTVVLSRERRLSAVADWDEAMAVLRRARLRACRRTFVGWPYQIAPALAALLLREEQARAAICIAAARDAAPAAQTVLPLALAASAMES